jgi:TolA-binding protein
MSSKLNRFQTSVSALLTLLLTMNISSASAATANELPFPQWKSLADSAYDLSGEARQKQFALALQAAKASPQPDFYPESEVIFSMAVAAFQDGKYTLAQQYFSYAAGLKRKAIDILLSGNQEAARLTREMILPAYRTSADEKAGKIHSLANCLLWLGRSQAKNRQYQVAAVTLAEALTEMRSNPKPEMEVIIMPDTLLEYAQVLYALHEPAKARKMELEANRLLKERKLLLDR